MEFYDFYKNKLKNIKEGLYSDDEDVEIETIGISGEYWIDENGDVIYADGDVGDMNHESIIINYCVGQLASEFNLLYDIDQYLSAGSSLESDILEEIGENTDFVKKYLNLSEDEMESTDWMDLLKNDPADAMIHYLIEDKSYSEKNASDLVFVAYGSFLDARKYGVKTLNWKRVHGDSIETKKLTSDDLKIISRGILNAIEQEGLLDDEENEEKLYEHPYNISTYTGKLYTITLTDMERGNVSGLELAMNGPKKTAAGEQLKQLDKEIMPNYYKDKPFGDSFEELFQTIIY